MVTHALIYIIKCSLLLNGNQSNIAEEVQNYSMNNEFTKYIYVVTTSFTLRAIFTEVSHFRDLIF